MVSAVLAASLSGMDAELVHVETDISQGLPSLTIVGLPDMTVKESKERVRSALAQIGCDYPMNRITVNLAPADTRKEGSHFDLPIAVGILIASGAVAGNATAGAAFIGELSLDGTLNHSEYGVALALGLKEKGVQMIFLPECNLPEMKDVDDVAFYPAICLNQVFDHLTGFTPIVPTVFARKETPGGMDVMEAIIRECGDYADVKGQERAKRAVQICAAGWHDMAMYGPPGVGKSMIAARIPSVLPPLCREEILEVTKIYNIAGRNPCAQRHMCGRPFRAPHHSATATALVGGGARPRPGELSLAHKGVLFLDELPEFGRRTLDMLRQPIEDRYIELSRVGCRRRYPCEFIFVAAMNPCPCGYYGDSTHECRCSASQRRKYASKVSGPLLDRIDLHVFVGRVEYADLVEREDAQTGASSKDLLRGVLVAQERQAARNPKQGYGRESEEPICNGRLSSTDAERICALSPEAEQVMKTAYRSYGFSARQGRKMLRIARTIADIEDSDAILPAHVGEAVSYRRPENIFGGGDET
jgi:magnesium chelatase family protein